MKEGCELIEKIMIIAVTVSLLFAAPAYSKENEDTYYNTISAGSYCYYALKTDGTLYRIPYYNEYDDGWDEDDYNEYEDELALDDIIPEKFMENVLSVSYNCFLKEDGFAWGWDKENDEPTPIMGDVKSISSSGATMLIIKKDNTLWGMGYNDLGQLAQGTISKSLEQQREDDLKWKNKTECSPGYYDEPVKIMDDVKSAVIDYTISGVLKNDGTVWTFGGDQGCAALGIGGTWLVNNEPTKILSEMKEVFMQGGAGFAIDNDDTLWRWGSNYIGYSGGNPGDLSIPEKYIENVKYAANMPGYNLIIKTDNSLWIYGDTDQDNGDIGYTSSDAPIKLADNVAGVAGLSRLDFFSDDKILVLNDNGDLMLYAVPLYEDKEPYIIGKVMSNVRLPNEMPVDVNFTDISDKPEKTQKAINSLGKAGIISGTSETEFSPDKPITRAEIAALLLRMTAKTEENGNGGFSDVPEYKWYYHVAGASKKYEIVYGFEDNTFRGDETVSAVQLVSLASRVLRNEKNIDSIEDLNFQTDIPNWAKEDVALAMQEELISAEKDLINPNEPMTRGEAAVILYRLYNKI